MTSSLQHRLESWQRVLREGGPDWIVEHAPKAIAEIEAMIAASVDRNPEGEKPQALSAKHESAVGEAETP